MKRTIAFMTIGMLSIFLAQQAQASCLVIKKIESSIKTQKVIADLDPNYARPRLHQRSEYSVTATYQLGDSADQALTAEDFHWGEPDKMDYQSNLSSLNVQLSHLNSDCENEASQNALAAVLNEAKESGFELSKKSQAENILIYREGVTIPFNPKLYRQGGVPVR